MGAIFGRLLVAGETVTAVFALAAASGILPAAETQKYGPKHRDHGHLSPDSAEMREIAELLRREGFSEPYSLEREHWSLE